MGLRSALVFSAFFGLAALGVLPGCARAPNPVTPQFEGSIGMPHRGVLTAGAELPREGEGFRWLRNDDRHHGLPRFVATIERAAGRVARERPGATLAVGDLSRAKGGQLLPHFSHRNGRDADLLFYVTTLEGAPVESPGFVHFGPDGLAEDEKNHRFLRFDVEREWLLVKALLEDEQARIQWIFVSRVVEAMLVEWARARGDDPELVLRAMAVMQQPNPGGVHDDHVHIRTACLPDEEATGCETPGPPRPWVAALDASRAKDASSTSELLEAIIRPLSSRTNARAER